MKLTRPFAVLIGALLTGNAVADQVELSNGDRISGTLVEQNADQKFSYDREALIEMLDTSLAKQRDASAR